MDGRFLFQKKLYWKRLTKLQNREKRKVEKNKINNNNKKWEKYESDEWEQQQCQFWRA